MKDEDDQVALGNTAGGNAKKERHVERALSVRVVNGELVIRTGVNVLARVRALQEQIDKTGHAS